MSLKKQNVEQYALAKCASLVNNTLLLVENMSDGLDVETQKLYKETLIESLKVLHKCLEILILPTEGNN